MSTNVKELQRFLADKPVGSRWDVATSQYAYNTTSPGYRFDFHSTAPAVRGLAQKGLIEANYGWRYYEVTKIA